MKTTKVFIVLSAIISVLLFSFGFYDGGVYFIFVTACIFILNSAFKKNAQLTSKLHEAEFNVNLWKERFRLFKKHRNKNILRIQELTFENENLKTLLESTTESAQKWEAYLEKERARSKEKYERLYKGKKKTVATEQKGEQPYQIEGKSIKQLVEENLGIEINVDGDIKGILCGFNHSSAILGDCENSAGTIGHGAASDSTVILKKCRSNSYYWVIDDNDLYNAIKKHRNIQ